MLREPSLSNADGSISETYAHCHEKFCTPLFLAWLVTRGIPRLGRWKGTSGKALKGLRATLK